MHTDQNAIIFFLKHFSLKSKLGGHAANQSDHNWVFELPFNNTFLHYSFRYKFVAQETGTHFYHSHSSYQRGDGAFGSFIVREIAEDDPQSSLYDYDLTEHILFPQEWFHIVRYCYHKK